MKKKILGLLLGLALTGVVLSGCGKDEDKTAEAPATTQEPVSEAQPAEEEASDDSEQPEAEPESAQTVEEAAETVKAGDFSLMDVDENMVEVGVYGMDKDGTELVFTMFTGPDGLEYVSLFEFDNKDNSGDVICGTYEASTEKDEDGDDWTYFAVSDAYTGNTYNLGIGERAETEEVVFFNEAGDVIEGKYLTEAETINYMGSAAALLSDNTGDNSASAGENISFVDGFYANKGDTDFMILFYENAPGDVAYVYDGENEAFAEYTVENASLDDGTEYLLITVGNTQMGYVEDGNDLYLVDDEGNIYAAERLTEQEAEELYNAAEAA